MTTKHTVCIQWLQLHVRLYQRIPTSGNVITPRAHYKVTDNHQTTSRCTNPRHHASLNSFSHFTVCLACALFAFLHVLLCLRPCTTFISFMSKCLKMSHTAVVVIFIDQRQCYRNILTCKSCRNCLVTMAVRVRN